MYVLLPSVIVPQLNLKQLGNRLIALLPKDEQISKLEYLEIVTEDFTRCRAPKADGSASDTTRLQAGWNCVVEDFVTSAPELSAPGPSAPGPSAPGPSAPGPSNTGSKGKGKGKSKATGEGGGGKKSKAKATGTKRRRTDDGE